MSRVLILLPLLAMAGSGSWQFGVAEAATGDCGQPQSIGSSPKTADALATLNRAVGSASSCDADPCICDVNSDGTVR